MPYYTEGPLGADVSLLDLPASTGDSAGAAFDEALTGNPTAVAYNWLKFKKANYGQKLTDDDAAARIKASGVKLTVPSGGLTEEALNILIERKKDEIARQTVLGRAPTGFLPGTARIASGLGGGLLDPLNIAAAFIPVVGEARYAQLLAGASGAVGRLGVRAGVGAAEGLVGAALLEPINYFGRTQMQDDYGMADSLMNLAFGVGMGAGLHGAVGAVGDALGVSRFAKAQQQKLLDEAAARLKAEGAAVPEVHTVTIPPEFRQPIELASVQDAPFAKRWDVTPESARARAVVEMADDMRAELLPIAGNRLDAGVVRETREAVAELEQRLQALDDPQTFKERAKQAQADGASRKEAETIARKAIADERADVAATIERHQQALDTNARASQAEQSLAEVDAGRVPAEFEARVQERVDAITQAATLERAMRDEAPPAAFVIGMADQSQREAAMRTAVAHAMAGRMPVVDPLFKAPGEVAAASRVVSEQQARPESVAVADFQASEAATIKLKEAPKTHDEVAAEQALAKQDERLQAVLKNLEQRGFDEKKLARLKAEMEPFDAALADSAKLADALQAAAVCGLRP